MFFVIVATVFFLLWLKWDKESMVAEPMQAKIQVFFVAEYDSKRFSSQCHPARHDSGLK